jgi:hypothetical protein
MVAQLVDMMVNKKVERVVAAMAFYYIVTMVAN